MKDYSKVTIEIAEKFPNLPIKQLAVLANECFEYYTEGKIDAQREELEWLNDFRKELK